MSIYSGFATRQQEQAYDSIVCDLIEFYACEDADQVKFHAILVNIQMHLAKMEENKYLEPKMSTLFKQIVTVAAAAADVTRENPTTPQLNLPKKIALPKQSLSFASEKLSPDIKNNSFGKIRHQITSKDDGLSSRGQANPQLLVLDKHVKRAASTHFSKDSANKRQLLRWGAAFDQQPMAVPEQNQKKNLQYVIRQYVSRGRNRRKAKR